MPGENRVSGAAYFKVGGVQHRMGGSFTYNLGSPKREPKMGPDGVHGYKEMPQAPFIEGEITDASDLDLKAMQALDNETVTLELANGKTILLHNAWHAADGNVGTEEGNIQTRWEGLEAEEA